MIYSKEDLTGLTKFTRLNEINVSELKRFISYPEYDKDEATKRIRELNELGVESLALSGPHTIQGHHVLGKGHVGIVLLGKTGSIKVAVKLRRTDADRENMTNEANMLAAANKVKIGPFLHDHSKNIIVMELIQGKYLGDWVNETKPNQKTLNNVLRKLLIKARRLDQIGLDHGELTGVKRHFIVTNKGPRIIDFESASMERRLQNVTSTTQSFFINKRFRSQIEELSILPEHEELLTTLKDYKKQPDDQRFRNILKTCNLQE